MSGWVHVGPMPAVLDTGGDGRRYVRCTTPTPDPASPVNFGAGEMVCRCHGMEDCPGDPQPTRCTCGHPIEERA